MACTRPRLPKVNNSFNGIMNRGYNLTQPKMIGTPIWVERDSNYLDVAFDMGLQHPKVIVVEYKRLSNAPLELYDGYTRIYIVGSDGNPVPYMSNMWKELYNQQEELGDDVLAAYHMDSEGRLTSFGGNVIHVEDASVPITDICRMYPKWSRYPKAKDYDTVEKLCEAQIAIEALKSEEKHNWISDRIKTSQATIKSEQENIAKLEKDLNKMYEEAADAMNLFEANGLDPNAIGSEDELKADTIADLDVGSLYPSQIGLSYKGRARITPIPNSTNGEVKVSLTGGTSQCSAGDLVYDFATNKMAVCLDGTKWVSTN